MARPTRRRKRKPAKYRFETRRLLYSGCSDEFDDARRVGQVYDPHFHPKDVVKFFKDRYDEIDDPIRFRTDKGAVGFVTKPVRPPTQAAYAALIGVRREVLWQWEKKYEEFAMALGIAKAYQEALLVELGTVGALSATPTNFVLKNLQGWTDKLESTLKGSVAFQFDAQDGEA